MNPGIPVTSVRTMAEIRAGATSENKFPTVLLSLFGCTALLLAAIGIYGTVSYGVSQRTHEIGVRMALGASNRNVRRMVASQGLLPVAIGLGLGLPAAWSATGLLENLLYEVSPGDPMTFLIVTGTLAAAALLASYLPARRASRVDPASVLRSD
jgi:putative ABC transport system permease protein